MKQELLKNQILYFRNKTKKEIEDLNKAYNKTPREITTYDFNNAIKSRQGALSALDFDFEKSLEQQIMDKLHIHNVMKEQIKVNFLDKEDKNLGMFFLACGGSNILMLLLTATENPLSACPVNKDILLSSSLIKLQEELELAIKGKDKKKITDLKEDIKITKELYDKNSKVLRQ